MIAKLFSAEVIHELASRIDSPAMLRMLRYLQQAGFVSDDMEIDARTVAVLQKLVGLGLVDADQDGDRHVWTSTANGSRVLSYLERQRPQSPLFQPGVAVNPRATTTLAPLSDWDQLKVLSAAESLVGVSPTDWSPEDVVRLSPDKPEYLLRVSSHLRAFIRVREDGGLELFDIVREETLQFFREAASASR